MGRYMPNFVMSLNTMVYIYIAFARKKSLDAHPMIEHPHNNIIRFTVNISQRKRKYRAGK